MLTIYQTSAPPPVDGTMIKQIGIDPTGGTDPRSPTVIWSEPDDHDEGPWDIEQRTAVYAQAPVMTVFVRVVSPYGSGGLPYLNYSFLDSAILARTPVVRATSPAESDTPTFSVNWDNAVPAPGGGKLEWRDVQWMDEAEGVWHDWITQSYEVEAQFVGERRHTYRFRARAWQYYPNGAHLYGPYRPGGDTSTTVIGPKLTGRVLTNAGNPIVGATVAISGTTYAATSSSDGRFDLDVWPWPDPQIVTVSHPWWESPAPVYGVTFGLTETVELTWTLRPPSDNVVNGEFEAGLDGWSITATQGGSATVVTDPVHTGHRALALGGEAPVAAEDSATLSPEVSVNQSMVLSDVWDPVLSFWYRPMTADADDRQRPDTSTVFNIILTVADPTPDLTSPLVTTRVFTPDLDTRGWQHVWYRPHGPDGALTGTVTIQFQVRHREPEPGEATTIYLDEVSLGAAPGGPHRLYLPLTARE